jgi:catechol 2,3-dioxygenase-like lactoylglutathione lyase family enzyme
VDWKLEVVTIPVTDLERAKNFYAERVGFNVDIDHKVDDNVRLIQMTAPGSACSIHLGAPDMEPGSIKSLFLVVTDVRRARAELHDRGVDVSEVKVFEEGSYRLAREEDNLDLVGCVFFNDPDGNGWIVQQIPPRK